MDEQIVVGASSARPRMLPTAGLEYLKSEVLRILQPDSVTAASVSLQPYSYWDRLKAEREGWSTFTPTNLAVSSVTTRLIPPVIPYQDLNAGDAAGDRTPAFRFPLSVDHQLIVLIQINVLRALMTNMSILSLQHRMPAECGAALSIAQLPEKPSTIPPALMPTRLQESLPHDPWIDMIPFPGMRDNFLLNQGVFDHDEFCEDGLGGLYEGYDDIKSRGIIVWGDPWSPTGWEVSEGFAKKYSLLLRGCDDLIAATQKYREARGEERLKI